MILYEEERQKYKPDIIKYLFIAESPPPDDFAGGSRHFYRSEPRRDDRLFVGTMRALYPEASDKIEAHLESQKEEWLKRFQGDGCYMIEALEESVKKKVDKPERQRRIAEHLPRLIERVKSLANSDTKIILIKSNVFEVAAEPLRQAGFNVLNQKNVDYPGHFNQLAYRRKLSEIIRQNGWPY